MKGVALADTHIGKQQFNRVIGSRNAREMDIAHAFRVAIEKTIDEQPDLITIAGDVFDAVTWRGYPVRAFQAGIRQLIKRTSAHIVIILGNHEAARTESAMSPVMIVEGESDRVHIVTEPKVLKLEVASGELVSIACFPFNVLGESREYEVKPDPFADLNVLLIHGQVRSSAVPEALPYFYCEGGLDVGREANAWSVIACGDYHSFVRLHPTALAFYSGSLERVSSNIWQEASEPKGFVAYDTRTSELRFIEIPTRRVCDYNLGDLEPDADGINGALQALNQSAMTRDSIVRLKGQCPSGERDAIDWRLIRELKQTCFAFQLDIEWLRDDPHPLGDRRAQRGITLSQSAAEFFREDAAEVRELAMKYLDEAGAA